MPSELRFTASASLRSELGLGDLNLEDASATAAHKNTLMHSLLNLACDWCWEQDAEFRFTEITGKLAHQVVGRAIGKTRWELGVINLTAKDWMLHRAALHAQLPFHDLEIQNAGCDGESYWASISGTPVFSENAQFLGYRGVGRIITEQKFAQEQIAYQAFYDALTDLPNRRLLLDRIQQAILISDRNRKKSALLFIDVDKFKQLNDTQGHHAGDLFLKQMADRLKTCVRTSDTVARLGGDEFIVLLEGLSEATWEASAQAEEIAKKTRTVLNQPYQLGHYQHTATVSIGVTVFGEQVESVEALLVCADVAMYNAKAAGSNTVKSCERSVTAASAGRMDGEKAIRLGILERQFQLYYQPQVNAKGQMTGVEALLRWNHPSHQIVMPAEFIPLAEKTGIILQLGEQALLNACSQLRSWAEIPDTADLTLSVNISARQLQQSDFVNQVRSIVDSQNANPERLKLELTESILIQDIESIIVKMKRLRDYGLRFALDDFGTGYSSLSYLSRLPLDQIKIDQSFVRDVVSNKHNAAIIKTIIGLGRGMGMGVIAEGVETSNQRDWLNQHGCTSYQGHLFGRAVPVEKLQF